jgi:hypothetical protein
LFNRGWVPVERVGVLICGGNTAVDFKTRY